MRFIIVDLEATCWMRSVDPQRMEIIEIGAVLLASKTGPVQKEYSALVRPIHAPKLSAFCMGLTGIRQQDVDGAADFSKVFPQFLDWIGPASYRLCSWGDFDLKQFNTDCRRHGIPFPKQFLNHINLKREFAQIAGVPPCGMKRAAALSGLRLDGKAHRGLDDARNIARLALQRILRSLSNRV